ncbi:MAG: desulfoferrodoxin [Lachnospiraceae bacterium]|nr:desulfoferrodoxin [Lachnospiraceae bacterium]
MKYDRSFLKCNICGNMIAMVDTKGGEVCCCQQPMVKLAPNTVDAATEKHVPVVSRDGNTVTVTVGSVPHPMTEEHHIAWICAAQAGQTTRVQLDVTGEPTATFTIADGDVTVYEYCNLHGLWAVDV